VSGANAPTQILDGCDFMPVVVIRWMFCRSVYDNKTRIETM